MQHRARIYALGMALLAVWAGCTPAGDAPGDGEAGPAPQVASSMDGVVVAAQPLAAEAGARMLRAGGNAADAAVAAAFAVSVVEPSMNSIGGRTQVLVRLPDGTFAGIDATTQAPATYDAATAPQASYGYPTVGVPGAVAGLAKLLSEHGTMELAEVMAPAIALAEDGFELLPGEAARHRAGSGQLAEFDGSRAHYLDVAGEPHAAGATFAQPDLAATLRAIAEGGADAFYHGPVAERIAADMEAHGGAVTLQSLADYEALDAAIVRGSYRGYDLVGTDIPASGRGHDRHPAHPGALRHGVARPGQLGRPGRHGDRARLRGAGRDPRHRVGESGAHDRQGVGGPGRSRDQRARRSAARGPGGAERCD